MSRREALEAAFDELESQETDLEAENETNKETPPERDRGGEPEQAGPEDKEVEDPKGRAPDGEETSAGAVGDKTKEVKQEKATKDEALGRAAEAAAGASESTKPPISWKPAAKEQWAKLPLDIKSEVLRREQEMSRFISQNDHHRKFTESFANIVKPYHHLIQAQNSTPLQAVKNVFSTMAGLTLGNQEQKARIVSEIIQNYGIDIQTLDRVLSGSVTNDPAPPRASMDPAIAQALQPVYGFMNEIQQARQQTEQRKEQEAVALIEKHADKPFFDDLRDDMADLMEIAAKRGVDMTLEDAYQKAVSLNPEISAILASRKAAEEARKNGGTRIARARRAASTITGAPANGADGKASPKTRREQIAAAWDEASSQ